MYVPSHFRESNPAVLCRFMEQHSFATLVSQAGNEPFASHLPLLLDRDSGPHGRLLGHVARANPHAKIAGGHRALAIFHGPHAYISPTWYESENVVPTWNYAAVHAYGTLRWIDDRDRLSSLIRRTVERYEAPMSSPWSVDSQDDAFIARLLEAIVGFEIEIDRLEGKWKLNQNHNAERRQKVIDALQKSGRPDDREIADLMRSL